MTGQKKDRFGGPFCLCADVRFPVSEKSDATIQNCTQKMKEMRRLCVYIVYAYEQAPQDIVDKRPAVSRRPVEKLQIVQKSFRRKTLENKVFF